MSGYECNGGYKAKQASNQTVFSGVFSILFFPTLRVYYYRRRMGWFRFGPVWSGLVWSKAFFRLFISYRYWFGMLLVHMGGFPSSKSLFAYCLNPRTFFQSFTSELRERELKQATSWPPLHRDYVTASRDGGEINSPSINMLT